MSKGTSSGLLEDAKTQSVFKHAILNNYFIRFVTMTARWVPTKRVVLLDGFAGRGRYPDGKPASGEHMLLAAMKAKNSAHVEVVLVEQSEEDFQHLSRVTTEYQKHGVTATVFHGDVEDHLDAVVRQANGVPLFLFLDPCGANVPYEVLERVLVTTRRPRRPATEALLNISADLTRRAAGVVNKGQRDHKVIERLNVMCGGDWWQRVALDAHAASPDGTWETAAEAVVGEYARRLGEASRMNAVVVPVRRRAHHQPVYHLVFLTRAEHGLWVFGDAHARARHEWMRALGPDQDQAESMLFHPVEDQIEHEQHRGLEQIKENMLALVAHQGRVKLVDHTVAIFGHTYGEMPEKFVRKAARELNKAGKIQLNAKPKQPRDWEIWL
ncbi:three-Cys-motif partner protein TcmP [Saccharopolyspora sp. NPDC002376]